MFENLIPIGFQYQQQNKNFSGNVIPVLLFYYGTWKTAKHIEKKLATFQTICLRKRLNIYWTEGEVPIRGNTETNQVNNIEKKMDIFGPCL